MPIALLIVFGALGTLARYALQGIMQERTGVKQEGGTMHGNMEDSVKHERFEGVRTLMRVHIGESDRLYGKPLYEAIVELLRREKFSGATVLRGVAGFGGSSI